MDLREIARVLRRRWKAFVACFVAVGAVALVYLLVSPKTYTASAQIFVSANSSDSAQQLAQGNLFVQARVQSYTNAITSPTVTAAVIQQLGLNESQKELASQLSADAPVDKVVINIHAQATTPDQAARVANAASAVFTAYVEQLEQLPNSGGSPVKLTVIQPASAPDSPSSPDLVITVALAVVVGLALGVSAAVVREAVDKSIKSREDLLEASGAPVLGAIPFDRTLEKSVVAVRNAPHGARAEAFRQLRTTLQFISVDNPPKIISVSSSLPAEGKTTCAINLAATIAENGSRVCLVEADLRRPTVAQVLGLVSSVGLTSVLVGATELQDAVQNAGENLAVLTAGEIPPNPTELLSSHNFRLLLEQLQAFVDVIVLDTAPILPVADGAEVCAIADATLLVARAGKTNRGDVTRSVERLSAVQVSIAGTLLNMTGLRGESATSYAYYYGTLQREDS